MLSFGTAIRGEFQLGAGVIQLNNGSYGTVPKRVRQYQRRLQDKTEEAPDSYFNYESKDLWTNNIAKLADFVGAKPENLAFLDNVTTGVNAAVRSLGLGPGEGLLSTTWTYNPIKFCCRAVTEAGADLVVVPLTWPVASKQNIVDLYEEYLEKHPHIKIAIVDHITSATATVMPIKEIIALCHKHNVVVIIDGAHVPGQLPINLEEIGADFYAGNLNKWLFAPRSSAFLYVDPKHHRTIHAPVTSYLYKNPDSWRYEFYWQGGMDDSGCSASIEGIKFLQDLGGLEALYKYNCKLLDEAVSLLVEAWGTEEFPIPEEMKAPFMRLVRLPDMKATEALRNNDIMVDYVNVWSLQKTLWERYKLIMVAWYIQGACWTRISAQVYNTLEEYRTLATSVLALKNEGF